ncbi:MAG: TMEM175 family protein [Sphingomicrobium sp.]
MSGTKSPSLQRFEFFTDGVFAIIMTIMAIELKIPEVAAHLAGDWDFRFLAPEMPKLLSYTLGFFMIATGWVSHLLMASMLERTNIRLITTNLVFLFLASLLPAATAFVGDYPTLPKAVMLWSAVSAAVLIWGDHALVRAARSAGLPVVPWAARRNLCASFVAIFAVVASSVSIHAPWVLIFAAYALHWLPIRYAIWLFEPRTTTRRPAKEESVMTFAAKAARPAAKKTVRRPRKRPQTS